MALSADTAAAAEKNQTKAARVAIAATVVSLVTLLVLHSVRSDLHPSWHVVSEYAAGGSTAWVMALCFASLALACAAVGLSVATAIRTFRGWIGLGGLGLAVIGLVMGAVFPIDAITDPPGPPSMSGQLHSVGSMLGNAGLIIGALCLGHDLARDPLWASVRSAMLGFAHLTWIAFVLMVAAVASLIFSGTMDGLGGIVGWANRLLMLAYFGWIITTAWPVAKIRSRT